MPSEHFTTISS